MAIRTSYFFRPIARADSGSGAQQPVAAPTAAPLPSPTPMEPSLSNGSDRPSRPLNKIAMGLRRVTPAPSRTSSPAPLVQDGTYLEALSLKLSEAVSKALAQPSGAVASGELLGGRRPIPAGRGTALGALIASELNAAAGNANLRRAIVRALQRPMSVLRTNIATNLLPLLSSPAFLTPAVPTVQAPNPNPTQLHALAYATFAGELVEAFNEMGLGTELDSRDSNLRAVREDLVSMVGRVVGPLVGAIKTELCPLIEGLEQTAPATMSTSKGVKVATVHPSMASLYAVMPIYAKALARYASTPSAQTHLASLLISLAWRGLIALSAREPTPTSSPPTPKMAAAILGQKKPRQLSTTSPPSTPPAGRFMLKLPPSRPPSPPNASAQIPRATAASDAKALFDLLNTLPRPAADKEATKLAKEAVDEVFDALRALVDLLEATQAAAKAMKEGKDTDAAAVCETVGEDLPTLIALPVLLRAFVLTEAVPASESGQPPRTVADLLGMKEGAYRSGFLHGFSRAEEYAPAVGARVLDVLAGPGWKDAMGTPNAKAVAAWLAKRMEDDAEDMLVH